MRISRSEPMGTSKRVTKAAPLRHKFSLEVSSSKLKPRRSRPRTFSGRRTAILRSDLCLEGELSWTIRGVLVSGRHRTITITVDREAISSIGDHGMVSVIGNPRAVDRGGSLREEVLDTVEH